MRIKRPDTETVVVVGLLSGVGVDRVV